MTSDNRDTQRTHTESVSLWNFAPDEWVTPDDSERYELRDARITGDAGSEEIVFTVERVDDASEAPEPPQWKKYGYLALAALSLVSSLAFMAAMRGYLGPWWYRTDACPEPTAVCGQMPMILFPSVLLGVSVIVAGSFVFRYLGGGGPSAE